MPLTTTIGAQLNAILTGAPSDAGLATASARHPLEKTIALAEGTGAGQASKVWTRKDQSLAASATETWDLSGALLNAFGLAAVFTKVKALMVYAQPTNTNDVVVGGATNAVPIFGGATHTVALKPGGLLLLVAPDVAGYAVGAGATDELKITNSAAGTAVVYDIVVVGS